MSLPEKYLDTMKQMLGNDFQAYIDSFNDNRLYGLRVNTLKITPEEFLRISPFELKPIPWKASILFCRTLLYSGA